MKTKINVGLVGVGRLGKSYAHFLKYHVPNANLIAVADLIPERASLCAEELEIATWYDNHHDLNHDPQIDAVVVCATTINHKEIIIDAARANKIVFSEKPLTLNLADAREIRDEVERAGIYFQMGFMRRFDKGFAAAKRKIEQGVIGTPVVFRGSSRDPFRPSLDYLRPENSGGQILDMAVHDFDIAQWYMGDITTIFAIGGVLAYPEIQQVNDTDNVVMAMTFSSGALGEIDISRNGVYGYDIRAEVLGTKGTLQAGYLRETPVLVMTKEGVTHDVVPYFPERFREAYIAQLNDFVDNLVAKKDPPITISDGIKALQVAEADTRSLQLHQVTTVADF